ncbi:hypothetical protein GQ43DRAFT_48260 [Delitschia confertaspora ATCC 74209]|uniref:RING-type domain-containing protein n=1 Tax=Delitschia confertaspora ATCC 74209 TaxID=1513339 RepID=A0A9P4JMR8_9PLEO|nr:hypothetical protein GQ43DRAFT_48260 [Delitschia confertaspora ATCC 74209]
MTSVFSSITWPPRSRRMFSSGSSRNTDVANESNEIDEPDLRELNAALQALTDVFPDIQPEVFREMLQSFSEQSRLEVITDTLLKQGAKWIRGRYRMPLEQEEQRQTAHKYKYRVDGKTKDTRGLPLALEETFRSQAYKDAAKEALYHEFKGLSHATIKAVLAEYNYSYTSARPTLLAFLGKSWKHSITSFLMRRKPPSAENHPLIIWTAVDPQKGRLSVPLLVKTKSRELNEELYKTLIQPVLEQRKADQIRGDHELAYSLTEAEAEEVGEVYDCECCYSPNTVQQMSTCDMEGHYICFRCIRYSINAALYDQGWARSIDAERCTLRCIAPITDGGEECTGCIPLELIKRALLEEEGGDDTYRKLHERFSTEALLRCELPLIRCPFCPYAELDEFALPNQNPFHGLQLKVWPLMIASVPLIQFLYLASVYLAFRILLFIILLLFPVTFLLPYTSVFLVPMSAAVRRLRLKRRGLKFPCLSPTCSRASCLSCSAPWHDPHTCYSSQRQSLRLTLERATTDAVKRTCPNCNLGFVKSEGCNKLVCLCGYSMCYICRENLSREGYHHFCQHFREHPGQPCPTCDKCDLYRVEDEEIVVKRAKERAEKEWWEKQGVAAEGMKDGAGMGLKGWETWLEKALDMVIA